MEIEKFKNNYCRWENNIRVDFKHKQHMGVPYIMQKLWEFLISERIFVLNERWRFIMGTPNIPFEGSLCN